VPEASASGPSTFGSEVRFPAAAAEEEGPALSCPSDRFLSNRPAVPGALILPEASAKPTPRSSSRSCGKKDGIELAVGVASAPGLRGVHSSWAAHVRETLLTAGREDLSTDAGSARSAPSSEESSVWSASPSDLSSRVNIPGPGAYSPDYAAGRPSTARGTPSFGRYTSRKLPGREEPDSEASVSTAGAETTASTQPSPAPVVRGGWIAPLPSEKPRMRTARATEEKLQACRPFYDALVQRSAPTIIMRPESGIQWQKGRLQRLRSTSHLGPGTYALPGLKEGPNAVILPEAIIKQPPRSRRTPSAPPGPADYDCERAVTVVYPSASATDFRFSTGHYNKGKAKTMGFQKAPLYVVRYGALHPKWEAVRRRSLSAVVAPLPREMPQLRSKVGPGTYEADESATQRKRPDLQVLRWIQPEWGEAEHMHGLFKANPVDRTVRGDPRDLLSHDADLLLRRSAPSVIIRPESAPPVLRDGKKEQWKLYDLPPATPPRGDVTFARRIRFQNFRLREAAWQARQEHGRYRHYPNLWLNYSLPSLEVLKPRAPQIDFSRMPERPASDPGDDSPRDGDVLLLSFGAEKGLLHPRVPEPVDMARQLGRASSAPPAVEDMEDDFEELVLSPRPVKPHVPMYVDMARAPGRPEQLELSAHLWADADGVLYAYQPSAGLRLRDETAEELHLSALPGDRLVRKRPKGGDFWRPLGRPGVDPRLPAEEHDLEEEALLTNLAPRFRPRPRSRAGAASSEAASGLEADAGAGIDDGLGEPGEADAGIDGT